MKLVGLALVVGGWALAVGGLVTSDATAVRLIAALIGLAVSLGGITTLNTAHMEHAVWKTRRS